MIRPKTRLYLPASLQAGKTIALPEDRAHFLAHVLRIEAGEPVAVFNASDGEWLATVHTLSKKRVELQVQHMLRPAPAQDDSLWLLFAPLKKDRQDFLVEKATEIGATTLWPVFTQYTQSNRVNTERLMAQAIEAAEQCERLDIPAIRPPVDLPQALANWPPERVLFWAAERGAAEPLAQALEPPCPVAAFLIGPEGGFSPEEISLLRSLPFVRPVHLGPRILRAETAALVALAGWQMQRGDGRPPKR